MLSISNNGIITFVHGDNIEMPLFINVGDEFNPIRYILTEDDKVYFSILQPHEQFEKAILRKIYTKDNLNENGDVIIKLSSDDTINLLPGSYYYEIKTNIKTNNNTYVIDTIVPRRKLYIIQ